MDIATDVLNYIFTGIFALEAVIKIISEGKLYFSDGWNKFDLVIVLGSLIGIIAANLTSFSLSGATTIMRAFRLLRILRLTKKFKSLRTIFNTFLVAMPAISNVGSFLLFFLYIFSIIGMLAFGKMKRVGIMNEYLNFENFSNSFLTLFIVATGDCWNMIMAAFATE